MGSPASLPCPLNKHERHYGLSTLQALCQNWYLMVNGESVEKACSEVAEYSDEQMVSEFDRFFRAQPAICDFIVELTHESGQKIQELSLFLSYMIFKTIGSAEAPAREAVNPEDIETAYRDTELWMESISEAEGGALQSAIAASLEKDMEPYLLQYIISELNEPMEDGADLNDEEKGEVFFVLKTVISTLTAEPRRRIIEID
jgi:hypothetical protein